MIKFRRKIKDHLGYLLVSRKFEEKNEGNKFKINKLFLYIYLNLFYLLFLFI